MTSSASWNSSRASLFKIWRGDRYEGELYYIRLESPIELTDEQSAFMSSYVRVESNGRSTSSSADGAVVRL